MILVLLGTAWAAKGHLVIVDGDRDRETAELQQRMWHAEGWPTHGDWPRLLDSAEVPGLNPGFHVLALGFFEEEAPAEALAAFVNDLGGGAYVREVQLDDGFHALSTHKGGAGFIVTDCQARSRPLASSPADATGRGLVPAPPREGLCVEPVPARCTSEKGAIYLDNGPWHAQTSEDWAWFSNDVATAAKKAGVYVDNRAQWVLDRCDGTRVKIEKQETVGYWVVRPGGEPLWIQHDMTEGVLSQASAYLGVELSLE